MVEVKDKRFSLTEVDPSVVCKLSLLGLPNPELLKAKQFEVVPVIKIKNNNDKIFPLHISPTI